MVFCVNTDLEAELGIEINGYEDLLNPELKGKIIVAAPDASSSGWRQLQTILATMGDEFDDDKGWNYIEQLLPDVLDGTVQPGRVFDRTVALDEVPDGYRAMADREALKVLVRP